MVMLNNRIGQLIQKATKKVLNGGSGNLIHMQPDTGEDSQQWLHVDTEDGYFTLENKAMGLMLDGNGSQVYLHVKNSGDYQKWRYVDVGDGYYKLEQKATGHVLDGNGTAVYMLPWNSGDYQRWAFVEKLQNTVPAFSEQTNPFRELYPLDFDLLDEHEQAVLSLLVTDGQAMTLHIKNVASAEVICNNLGSQVTEDKCHFTLRFRQGTLINQAQIGLNAPPGWLLAYAPHPERRSDELYILAPAGYTLKPGETQTVALTHIQADSGAGSRNTRVEFLYQQLTHKERPLQGHRQQTLSIVNQSLSSAAATPPIPLHAGFAGSNVVLNDATAVTPNSGSASSLTVQLTNTSAKHTLTFKKTDIETSQFILKFDTGDSDKKGWALGTTDQVAAIIPLLNNGWVADQQNLGPEPVWVFTPPTDNWQLAPGDVLTLAITNIRTAHPAGPTYLHLSYENVPGFADGRFTLPIQKSPLVYTDTAVGIGLTDPRTNLVVNGSVMVGPNFITNNPMPAPFIHLKMDRPGEHSTDALGQPVLKDGIAASRFGSDPVIGKYLQFNGPDDSLALNKNSAELGFIHASFTVTVWVTIARHKTDNSIIGSYDGLHLVIREQYPYLGFFSNDTKAKTALVPGKWYHLAFRYNLPNQEQAIFIDGKLDIKEQGHPPCWLTNSIEVGRWGRTRPYFENAYLEGGMADLRIYHQALSDEDIKALASRIDENSLLVQGKVGIGTAETTAKLNIAGDINLNGRNITQFSDDSTLKNSSSAALPTERAVKEYVDSLFAGSVTPFATDQPPDGWLACNGQAVSRSQYPRLFQRIGTRFGAGDGQTTFNLPDLRGEFVRGWDNGRGVETRTFGSAQNDDFKGHLHPLHDSSHSHTLDMVKEGRKEWHDDRRDHVRPYPVWHPTQSKGKWLDEADGYLGDPDAETNNSQSNISMQSVGGLETRPRNVALLYCIKY